MRKLFVSKYEEITNEILSIKSKQHDIHVYLKVYIADIFNVEFNKTPKEK